MTLPCWYSRLAYVDSSTPVPLPRWCPSPIAARMSLQKPKASPRRVPSAQLFRKRPVDGEGDAVISYLQRAIPTLSYQLAQPDVCATFD